jgi:hypothetical protein
VQIPYEAGEASGEFLIARVAKPVDEPPPPVRSEPEPTQFQPQPQSNIFAEEQYSNTIFRKPLNWITQRHLKAPNAIMLTDPQDPFRQTNPQYWIEIAESKKLQGDFGTAFDNSLRPPGYTPELGQKLFSNTEKGTVISINGAMRNANETIYFWQVSVNPGDRYEEIVFCALNEFKFKELLPLVQQFLLTVDFENIRRSRK